MSEEKALCEIEQLDNEHYLYWHGNHLFDWMYKRGDGSYNLFWREYSLAQGVSKYRIIRIEPMPEQPIYRPRLTRMIEHYDDETVEEIYFMLVNLYGA